MRLRLTVNETLTAIRQLGLSASYKDREYRVTLKNVPPSRAEAVAYYTNDATDALYTAQAMHRAQPTVNVASDGYTFTCLHCGSITPVGQPCACKDTCWCGCGSTQHHQEAPDEN